MSRAFAAPDIRLRSPFGYNKGVSPCLNGRWFLCWLCSVPGFLPGLGWRLFALRRKFSNPLGKPSGWRGLTFRTFRRLVDRSATGTESLSPRRESAPTWGSTFPPRSISSLRPQLPSPETRSPRPNGLPDAVQPSPMTRSQSITSTVAFSRSTFSRTCRRKSRRRSRGMAETDYSPTLCMRAFTQTARSLRIFSVMQDVPGAHWTARSKTMTCFGPKPRDAKGWN